MQKKDLIDDHIYLGECRNAEIAIWNKEKNVFIYKRHKFGAIFEEDIKHPEDDNDYDLFVPIRDLGHKIDFEFK